MTRRDDAKEDKTRAEANDAIAVLTADHRQVRALFHRYEATHEQALKWRIAAEVCTALERHTLLEDTVLYAAFAVATDAAGEMLLGEALRAHQLCTVLSARS